MNDTNSMIEALRAKGFRVELPVYREPETPKQFCRRIGLNPCCLARTLSRLPEGLPAVIVRGKRNITSIRSSAQLDAWILNRIAHSGRDKRKKGVKA